MTKIQLYDLSFEKFIDRQEIKKRVEELAQQIEDYYYGQAFELICVMSGAFVFCSDLCRALLSQHLIHFIKLNSYNGLESSGQVEIEALPQDALKNKNIVIVEDIVETGLSLSSLKSRLMEIGVNEVKIVSLFVKPECLQYNLIIDWSGFNIGHEFIVGYGLDYNQLGRGLPDIGRLAK